MNIFVYGSLVFSEVMQGVVGRQFIFREGLVRGYARFKLRDEPQAAVIPFPDTSTKGIVYVELDKAAVRRLDAFVGKIFDRVEVNVETGNDEWVEAETHVLKVKERKRLSAKPWDENEFRQKHLAKFMRVDVP